MKRIYSFDYFKFFAIIGVIIIHTGGLYGVTLGNVSLNTLGFFLETTARFAVPFFFITAGFLFGIKAEERGVKSQYPGYAKRLVLLYGVWSLVYFISNAVSSVAWFGLSFGQYVKESLSVVDFLYYGMKISEPLWFLPALFISISLVSLAIRFRFLGILTLLGLILNIAGLFSKPQMYGFLTGLSVNTRDALFFGLLYTSLGAFLAEKQRYSKIGGANWLWYILTLLSLGLVFVEKNLLGSLNNWADMGDYWFFTIPLTFSLFMACVKSPELGKSSFITKLGTGSLGVYLIHSLIQAWASAFYYPILGDGFWETTIYRFTIIPLVALLSWLFYYTIPGALKRRFSKKDRESREGAA